MTYTLFDLTYMVARELGLAQEGIATGGSTTTLVDTLGRAEPDDYWNNGTVWVLRDAAGAGAAPEGEYAVITDYVQSTATLTLREALTAAVAGGDRYGCMMKYIPLNVIIQQINDSLMLLGTIPYADKVSITIENNKTEYALPIASKQDLREVWLQTYQNVTDNQYLRLYNWKVEQADPGAAPRLVLPEQYTAGYALKLVYMANHPAMKVATATLSEFVPVERVILPAVLGCYKWRKVQTGWNRWDDQIKTYEALVQQVKLDKRIVKPGRTPHITMAPQDQMGDYPGDRTPR